MTPSPAVPGQLDAFEGEVPAAALLLPRHEQNPENGAEVAPTTLASIESETDPEEDDFSWKGTDIVLHEQRAIAVYRNRFGGIVIREESPDGDGHDAFVVLRDDDAVQRLVSALQRESGGRQR